MEALEDFGEFDTDKSGQLTPEPFKLLLRSLCKKLDCPSPSKAEALRAFAEIDPDNSYEPLQPFCVQCPQTVAFGLQGFD